MHVSPLQLQHLLAATALLVTGCGSENVVGLAESQNSLAQSASDTIEAITGALEAADAEVGGTTQAVDSEVLPMWRGDVGLALRTLASGRALCGNQLTVTPVSKQSDCASIGQNGTYAGGGIFDFNSCRLPWGGRVTGRIVIDITRTLAAGQTCSPGATIDVTRTVAFNEFDYNRATGSLSSFPTLKATSTSTYPIGQPPSSLRIQITEAERLITGAYGEPLLHHRIIGSSVVTIEPSTDPKAPPTRVQDSKLTIDDLIERYAANITTDGLVRIATCCRAIRGAMTAVRNGSVSDTHTMTFGPRCFDASVDDKKSVLTDCE